ncbi:MAG TPA: hypothetical protein VGM15_03190 [Burkholderiaceae bacterium]|jgi:hypothetical protein
MAVVTVSPIPRMRYFDANGVILSGGKLFTYAAGTTTKQNTYTDSTGATPNANPIILDAQGYATVFLDQTKSYKFVLAPSTDTDPPTSAIWTVDGITVLLGGALLPQTLADAGSLNTIVLTPGTALAAYVSGLNYYVTGIVATNTGATTVNVSALGTKALQNPDGTALLAGQVVIGGTYLIEYNGTAFVLVGSFSTAAQFDNSGRGSTTAFVQRALGSLSGSTTITTNTTLTAANAGQEIIINGAATATLPVASTCPKGTVISFRGQNASAALATQGTDTTNINGFSTAAASFALPNTGDWAVMMSDGVGAWISAGLNRANNVQVFTTGSAATYTTPYGAKAVKVRAAGGGGGGGGATANAGGSGNSTTFSTLTCSGGSGGGAGAPGGSGGGASGGDVNLTGANGSYGAGVAVGVGLYVNGGGGGNNPFGGAAGASQEGANGLGAQANTGGGGGGGGSGNNTTSGGGGGAGGYAEKTFFNPSATYTYTVGTGGTGGAAGTFAGGNGAAGLIICEASF